jgi:hypothetical protein
MTADQVIELARKTVSVKIRVGPPPGLPEQYKAQLRSASETSNDSIAAPTLAGTGWEITDNINGFISHLHVILRGGGAMDVKRCMDSRMQDRSRRAGTRQSVAGYVAGGQRSIWMA